MNVFKKDEKVYFKNILRDEIKESICRIIKLSAIVIILVGIIAALFDFATFSTEDLSNSFFEGILIGSGMILFLVILLVISALYDWLHMEQLFKKQCVDLTSYVRVRSESPHIVFEKVILPQIYMQRDVGKEHLSILIINNKIYVEAQELEECKLVYPFEDLIAAINAALISFFANNQAKILLQLEKQQVQQKNYASYAVLSNT